MREGEVAMELIGKFKAERDIAIKALQAILEEIPVKPKLPLTSQIKDIAETALIKLKRQS